MNEIFRDGQAHVICPNCGTELDFSHECGMQFVAPPTPGVHVLKAKENGLDFSKFVAANRDFFKTASAEEVKDKVAEMIREDGYIKNTKGHRRFVTAQMFRMLNHKGGYTAALNEMPYVYQWQMLVGRDKRHASELKTLAHLEKSDEACFKERTMFFNKYVVISMLHHYYDEVVKVLNTAPRHDRYILVKGHGYVDIARLNLAATSAKQLEIELEATEYSYQQIYEKVYDWYKGRFVNLDYTTKKSPAWVNAYKGSGAYYTMMNLIKYHDCKIKLITADGRVLRIGTQLGVGELKRVAPLKQGYELLGMLKEMIKDNNFTPTWK